MLVLLWLLFTFGALWFLIVRPQRRRLLAHQALMASLRPDDEVVTAGGIYGRIEQLDDDIAAVEVAPGVVIRVARGAIARRLTEEPFEESDDFDQMGELGSGEYEPGSNPDGPVEN